MAQIASWLSSISPSPGTSDRGRTGILSNSQDAEPRPFQHQLLLSAAHHHNHRPPWDLNTLLNPPRDSPAPSSAMSVDYNHPPPPFDIDPFRSHLSPLPQSAPANPHPHHRDPSRSSYDHPAHQSLADNMGPEHPSYSASAFFPPSDPFAPPHRNSSSSSLGHNFAMTSDSVYPHSSSVFNDPVPSSFHSSPPNPFDLGHSTYSSGKASPAESVNNFQQQQHQSPFLPSIHGHSPHKLSSSDDFSSNLHYGLPAERNGHGHNGFHPDFSEFPGQYPSDSQAHSRTPFGIATGGLSAIGASSRVYHGDGGMSRYEDIPSQFINPPFGGHGHSSANGASGGHFSPASMDDPLMRTSMHVPMGATADLQTFIRPYVDQYVRQSNRLAFGERSIIVMSSKVAQKSYGTEKRFLCPPPTAIMIGNSWWSDQRRRDSDSRLAPPRVTISISGEPVPQEGTIEWCSAAGKAFDSNDPPTGTTYLGRCVGKQLYISDVDEKKKKVEALVKVVAPVSDGEPDKVIGVFPSRPIKVISKPSKKRQSAKNLELCINHGSTISLFHRLRSQTVSTKYLCVSGSNSAFKGSDGAPMTGLDQRSRAPTPSFIARTASWDPFIIYIVDINKPAGSSDTPPPPPPQPDYPSPPPNAIPFNSNGAQIPIYYNQTVVLQCLTSGVVSPILIIRKVDHATIAVGGGLQEGAKGIADHYCTPDEVCGDPVSQLHKIAFEVYDPHKGLADPGTPGITGAFLSCMGEKVNTYRPTDGRQWNAPQSSPHGSASPGLPGSPMITTPGSASATMEYFGQSSRPESPTSYDDATNDGGRVKKKRSSSSGSGMSKSSGPGIKGRRRPGSVGSATSGRLSAGDATASSGALWQVDIGETSVWTIVGCDQIRYNFYVPPVLFTDQNALPSGSYPIPSKPVTPFPGVVKYLPPDRAAEMPKHHMRGTMAVKPHPHASKLLTVYGENLSKADPVTVFFGNEPSPYIEIRCTEVLACMPPESHSTRRRPIILVRSDGVIFPSSVAYP